MKKMKYFYFAFFLFFFPFLVHGITLGEYEAKLKKYQNEMAANQSALNKTESQIKNTEAAIEATKEEMMSLKTEISSLQEEIEKYNTLIKEKVLQSKQLMEYLQLSSGENVYLEYVFDADSTTDLIYRMAVVQQLIDYNNKVISDLEQMIDGNKVREEEIEKRNKVLDEKEEDLGNKLESLGEEKTDLSETSVSVKQQIKIYQELVNSYKKQGCKSSDVIGVDCAVKGEAGIFRRPTKTGYVTSEFGSRWGSFHRGIDISSENKRREKIYPVANGTIVAKYYDIYGALILAIEHYSSVNNKWYTSLYAHMTSYAPNLYVGKYVTSDQYIGYMGDTGYAFGVHLHLEIAPCRLYNLNDKNCSTWSKYTKFVQEQEDKGFKGPRGLITFPKGLYNTWKSR